MITVSHLAVGWEISDRDFDETSASALLAFPYHALKILRLVSKTASLGLPTNVVLLIGLGVCLYPRGVGVCVESWDIPIRVKSLCKRLDNCQADNYHIDNPPVWRRWVDSVHWKTGLGRAPFFHMRLFPNAVAASRAYFVFSASVIASANSPSGLPSKSFS